MGLDREQEYSVLITSDEGTETKTITYGDLSEVYLLLSRLFDSKTEKVSVTIIRYNI